MTITPSEIDELREEIWVLRAVLTSAIRLAASLATPPGVPLATTYDAIRGPAQALANPFERSPEHAVRERGRRLSARVGLLVESMRQDQEALGDPRNAVFSKGPNRPQ
jgi:hypothetical protein